MLKEQKNIFKQIVEYVKTESPAVILIAGDVYDRAVPSIDAVSALDDFLTELARQNVAVMLISGNHDSPERLNYASRLLADKQLFLCGTFDGAIKKTTLTDEYGEINFWLLPFIKPSSVRNLFEKREIESYDDAVSAAIETGNINYNSRNVLVSHQFFTKPGLTPLRSESEINPIGGLDAVNSDIVKWFDYVALGHLHGEQTVGAKHIRYAGSPIKYSFSECYQKKSVTLVELCEKGSFKITLLPLIPLHDMREIRGELDKLISDEVSSLADKEDYLRVVLTNEEELIDPMGKLRSIYPNIMALDFENSRSQINIAEIGTSLDKMQQLSPYELFCEFFLEISGSVMSEEQAKIVQEFMEKGEPE